jgi:hypothetical protein
MGDLAVTLPHLCSNCMVDYRELPSTHDEPCRKAEVSER